jgi:hypothetical protein
MACRIGDRQATALATTEEDEALETSRIRDRFQIAKTSLER